MNWSRAFALFALALVVPLGVASLVAGCGAPAPVQCGKCAPGYRCNTMTGACVADGTVPDSGAGAADMAMGKCVPPCAANQYCNGANRCAACIEDAHCPLGSFCKTTAGVGACVPGCGDDSRCGGGGSDAAASARACCSGQCADTATDAQNCGGCGKSCVVAHASASCEGGQCKGGACDAEWGDCNNDPQDGCEANLRLDTANCGACANKCVFANAIPACASYGAPDAGLGGCYIAACSYGFDDCNADPGDGCETSVTSDAVNCGACGNKCPTLPHSKLTCANAVCALTTCELGYADCNKDPKDGCESTLNTDVKNCGACNNACGPGLVCVGGGCTCQMCNIPNASAKCMNNQCLFDKCNPGYADCNNDIADGCEANLNFDANNCGGCHSVCPMNTPSCGAGQCTTLFTFTGVQQNLMVQQLAGWTQCYKDTFANSNTPVAAILAGCSKARLLTACRMAGSNTLRLAAMAPRADVIFDTGGAGQNNTHVANGVGWYFNSSWSWGFAPAGDMVSRNSCDIGIQQDADLRMCWHTGGGNINTGYRCGSTTLNGDASYERLIYQAD